MVPPTETTASRDARTAPGGRRAGIGSATAVRGQLAAREDVWIDGQFEGEIHAAGHQVTVGAAGRVRGEIRARSVVVEGELHGEAHAEHQVVVRAGARVQGDLHAPRVALEDGAWLDGTVDTGAPVAAPPVAVAAVAPQVASPPPAGPASAAPAASETVGLQPAQSGGEGGR